MNRIGAVASVAFTLLVLSGVARAQSWQPLTNQPSFQASNAYLLTDGTVIVQRLLASDWYRLTPDDSGSYVNGTWSQIGSMPSDYGPLYYASGVLADGRLIVTGGEYNLTPTPIFTNKGAIYDPLADQWTRLEPPTGWDRIGDAQSEILADGRFIFANPFDTRIAILDPVTLTYTNLSPPKDDRNAEEGWTLLPDGSFLTIDVLARPSAQRYVPELNQWVNAGSTPVNLVDPGSQEIGPALLRPDGTVFATGATGHNAIYNAATGEWSVGPDFPFISGEGQYDIADGPAALLPNGNVLCAASPGVYRRPVHFWEFDGTKLNQVPDTPRAPQITSYEGRMLVLPTGQILFTDGSTDVEVYTPSGTYDPSWAPTITSVPTDVQAGLTYTISGTQFNGLSEGSAYGDDAQTATNYPLVRLTNQDTGHVFYARTHDHSRMGVATGDEIVSTSFDVPPDVELGDSDVAVVTNGIPSAAVTVTISAGNP